MKVKITEDDLNVELESLNDNWDEQKFAFRVWRNGERKQDHLIVVKVQTLTGAEGDEFPKYHLYFDPKSATEYWCHSVTDVFGGWQNLKWLTIWAMAVYRHWELARKIN